MSARLAWAALISSTGDSQGLKTWICEVHVFFVGLKCIARNSENDKHTHNNDADYGRKMFLDVPLRL